MIDYFVSHDHNSPESLCHLCFIEGIDPYSFFRCHHHRVVSFYKLGKKTEKCADCGKVLKVLGLVSVIDRQSSKPTDATAKP